MKIHKRMGFPSVRFISVSCSHSTKQLDGDKSFVANLGPAFRANWEMAQDNRRQTH